MADNFDDSWTKEGKAIEYYGSSIIKEGGLRTPPVRVIIERQIKEFEDLIAARKNLIKLLDNNPGTEEVLDALRKIGI